MIYHFALSATLLDFPIPGSPQKGFRTGLLPPLQAEVNKVYHRNPNAYAGLIELLVDAYRNTDAHGSTTVLLTALDHTFGAPVRLERRAVCGAL